MLVNVVVELVALAIDPVSDTLLEVVVSDEDTDEVDGFASAIKAVSNNFPNFSTLYEVFCMDNCCPILPPPATGLFSCTVSSCLM